MGIPYQNETGASASAPRQPNPDECEHGLSILGPCPACERIVNLMRKHDDRLQALDEAWCDLVAWSIGTGTDKQLADARQRRDIALRGYEVDQ